MLPVLTQAGAQKISDVPDFQGIIRAGNHAAAAPHALLDHGYPTTRPALACHWNPHVADLLA